MNTIDHSKYPIQETIKKETRNIIYIWHPEKIPENIPENIPVQQVYVFTVSAEGLVCLVRDKEETRFTPPGGGVEKGETAEMAAHRECNEEAQFDLEDVQLLGSGEVINETTDDEIQKHCLQVRYIAKAKSITKFIPEKDGFETEQRIFVYYKDLNEYVSYMKKYETGRAQYEMLCEIIESTDNFK
jgi:ADP-ribose pyrophosphatase YjhB (NUDIX family)